MNNWKIIPTIVFTTVLIFGAGVFTGGILVDRVKQAHPHIAVKPHPAAVVPHVEAAITSSCPPSSASSNLMASSSHQAKPPEIVSKEFVLRLDEELRLTRDEHTAIEKIVNDGQNEMRKVVQDARLEMREVLTSQQRQQFDDLIKRPFRKPLFGTNIPPTEAPSISSTNHR